jgi:hypothetical protein
MSLVGLDLNSGRARAVAGPAARPPGLVHLDGELAELPLAISLDDRVPRVGRSGFALLRARPHLVCADYLPALGSRATWGSDRHRLDPEQALSLALAALAAPLKQTAGVVCTLPAYLDGARLARFARIAEASKLPFLGSMLSPLAAVLASPLVADPNAEPGLILVVEADTYAVSWSVVERRCDRDGGQLVPRQVQVSTPLARGVWLRRMLDGVANRCVRQTRRDPRESAATEQALYEQLAAFLDRGAANGFQARLQGEGWFHNLVLHADEVVALAEPLLRQASADFDAVLAAVEPLGRLSAVVLTHPAAALPGFADLLRSRCPAPPRLADEGDYGDHLLAPRSADIVHALPPDAPATMAHELAARIHAGHFPRGHLDLVALPPAEGATPKESGPARLTFQGREHLLPAATFTLGRDPSCDLVFASDLYPHVSGKHCEIVFDRRSYMLCDRSRHGTLLNDRPIQQQAALRAGDWIRLGPRGPVLRFLGETATGRAASNW